MKLFLKKLYLIQAVLLVTVVLIAGQVDAGMRVSMRGNGFWLHCRQSEAVLAARLVRAIASMKSFLAAKGLPLPTPVHLVLQEGRISGGFRTDIIPLWRVRVALQPPGPLEDGATEPDPWTYRTFMGLAFQSIYYTCGGVPALGRRLMGAVISPNRIIPPWALDGISHLLWELYAGKPGFESVSTLDASLRNTVAWPGVDKISNHPDTWPGPDCHRIWGRPFIRWLYRVYGWKPLLEFIKAHGAGVIPFEVNLKARKIFGLEWHQLWMAFSSTRAGRPASHKEEVNLAGPLYPMKAVIGDGRGGSKELKVKYRGRRPYIVLPTTCKGCEDDGRRYLLPAPKQVIALNGPVIGPEGQIAVGGCVAGDWDIWLYDGKWRRLIQGPGTQCHPFFNQSDLVFASDHGGSFAIYDTNWNLLSKCKTAGLRPGPKGYFCLAASGWHMVGFVHTGKRKAPGQVRQKEEAGSRQADLTPVSSRPYEIFRSLKPNFVAPDLFLDGRNVELGIVTRAEDAYGRARLDGGVRYAFSQQYTAWKLGGTLDRVSGRLTSYPLDYETDTGQLVTEARQEASISWRFSKHLFFSLNGRRYSPLYDDRQQFEDSEEYWLAGKWSWNSDMIQSWLQLEFIESRGPSLSGWVRFWPGARKNWEFSLFGGKSWGDLQAGHNTFRVGGDLTEGFFTQRTTRLFPLRGFATNSIEDGQVFSSRTEYFVPLARINAGYRTWPVFWRSLRAGVFADCGMASQRPSADQLLVGLGLEIVASMELAWDINANLHLGVAWPVVQPDYLDQQGPVLLFQIGRPL